MNNITRLTAALAFCFPLCVSAAEKASHAKVDNAVIADQRRALADSGAGFGPQAPRDINSLLGTNGRIFGSAPDRQSMNLCNIHFHENAEHRGGEFTTFAGNGDGRGYGTGFRYNGKLSSSELSSVKSVVGYSEHGDLIPGDTVEIHFVYSSADVIPGPTLGSCLSKAIKNPDLRVEAVVAVLVNDKRAVSLKEMAVLKKVGGFHQAPNLPNNLGSAVMYAGSTTGPGYNKIPSPFQVTWNVRPKVVKIDISSVSKWLKDNPFKESHAHGVRNLVTNPALLSDMQR